MTYPPPYGRGFGRGWGRGRGWGPLPTLPPLPPPPPNGLRIMATVDSNVGLNSPISFRFARAPLIAVVDTVGGKVVNLKILENPYATAPHGAGMGLGQWIVASGVKLVIAPRLGPNISFVLQQAGVRVEIVPPGIPLSEALRRLGITT